MKTILKLLVMLWLLVLSSGSVMAQTTTVTPCPTGKTCTVFIWMNGIKGTSPVDWRTKVIAYGNTYRAAHNPSLDPTYFVFDSVFNHGGYSTEDLAQASAQWISQAIKQVDFSDQDFVALIDMIRLYSGNGYHVVLVGHSQATFYTNFAYEAIRDKKVFPIPTIPNLPDPTKLSVVNIASASDHVADGTGRYTTHCGDIMRIVPRSLPSNINNDGSTGCSSGLGVHPIDIHQLDAYLGYGSLSQLQIYADLDLAANLPDPGCAGDINCYLKDNFIGYYGNNFRQVGDPILAYGSTIDTASHLGTLQMTSYNNYSPVLTGTGIASAPARLSLQSRRVFTGPFTVNLRYNAVKSGDGFIHISLNNASDGSPEFGLSAIKTGWQTLVFSKTDTEISLSVDGVLLGSTPSSAMNGYYLDFDLQGNNTLQVQNLSVVRGATAPQPPTMTLTPETNNLSVVQGNSGSVNLTLKSQNGMTGNPSLGMWCMGSCPSGFSYNFPNGTTTNLPANGSISARVTFNPTTATPGTYKYEYRATLSGTTAVAKITVTVTAPTSQTPTMTLTPASNALSVVRGNPVTANLVLTSRNGMTGNPTITLYCSVACPTGFSYNYTYGSARTLSANGTLPISATFTPSSSVTLGTSNFQYWVTLNGVTVKATIAVTVTASATTTTTGTIVVSTTNSVSTPCTLNGVAITAPVILTNQVVGTKSLSCTAPSGYTLNSVSPSSQNLSAGGTASFAVNLTAISQVGTVVVRTNGTVPSVSCSLNGISITGPGTFTNQPIGTKTLSCTPPMSFTLTSITPSSSQTLSAGGTVTFTVNLTAPTPVMSYLTVNTQPKINTTINVSIFGSNFVNGVQAYICNYPGGTCTATTTTLMSSGQLSLPYVQWSTPATIYLRVANPGNIYSVNFLTMVVIQ
ncbi:MAG: hypothetical protein WC884_03560 [Candidatus Paceibacterota bacterium]